MTIIFSNHLDDDCYTLSQMWQGVDGVNLIEILPDNDNYEQMVDDALAQEDDTLLLIGHGTTHGLLHPNFDSGAYLVHQYNIDLIHARRVICSWCYASTFCDTYHLRAFATSMFISNVNEAYDNSIYDVTQEYINNTDRQIDTQIMSLINSDIPMQDWVMRLGAVMDVENPIDVFNRQGLMLIE